MTRNVIIAVVSLAALLATPAAGDVKLPALVGDNMVLQRGMELPIWGWAMAGEEVTVTLAGHTATTTTGPDGRWRVRLPAMEAGGPHVMTIVGRNTITLENVMIGDVWLCAGGANMLWEVRRSANAEATIASAYYPNIRLFTVTKKTAHEPVDDVRGWWLPCNRKTVATFSAVAYHFGRRLHQETQVPIGLIQSTVGGAGVELWMPREVLMSDVEFAVALADYEKIQEEYQAERVREYQRDLARWQVQVRRARAEGRPEPRKPNTPKPARLGACYYNGMIHPLVPYGLKGVIWYQGEANVAKPQLYGRMFQAMIAAWWTEWKQGSFPFLFVQLANCRPPQDTPTDSTWARIREGQLQALSMPNTAMAVAIDLGEAGNEHPANKHDVGYRLYLAALKVAYGRDIVYSGPIVDTVDVRGDQAILTFKHVGSGLMVKGETLKGFAIAGPDRRFVWAEARIRDGQVIVSSPEVEHPVAVRYGWADNPDCNLYNAEGLPASPFRTDDWPLDASAAPAPSADVGGGEEE